MAQMYLVSAAGKDTRYSTCFVAQGVPGEEAKSSCRQMMADDSVWRSFLPNGLPLYLKKLHLQHRESGGLQHCRQGFTA